MVPLPLGSVPVCSPRRDGGVGGGPCGCFPVYCSAVGECLCLFVCLECTLLTQRSGLFADVSLVLSHSLAPCHLVEATAMSTYS